MDKIKFRGLSLTKTQFEEKYNLSLQDIEWNILKNSITKKWENDIDQIRAIASKYIRDELINIGYRPIIKDNKLTFSKDSD